MNGTTPDADEVMANDSKLLGAINGVQAVGGLSTQEVKRTTVGTTQTVLSSTSQSVTVSDTSVMVVSFGGTVSSVNEMDSSWIAQLQLLVDDSPHHTVPVGVESSFGTSYFRETRSVAGSRITILTAGTHTVALRWIITISNASGVGMPVFGIVGNGGSWSGMVVPAWE